MSKVDVAVIGGGASGFFAAVNLAKELRTAKKSKVRVVILESSSHFLKKVRISGKLDVVTFKSRVNNSILSREI